MAKLFKLTRGKGGPPILGTPLPLTNNDNIPPSPINRMICAGIAIATWVVVATPLFATASVQDGPIVPPYTRASQEIARQTWDPQPPILTPRRFIQPQSPVAVPPRTDTTLQIIRASWDPVPVFPQTTKRGIPTQQIDAPPPKSLIAGLIATRTWDEPSVSPIWTTASVQDGVVVQPSQPSIATRTSILIATQSWDVTPQPFIPRRISIPAQQIDAPPPSTGVNQAIIRASWEQPQPIWQPQRLIPQGSLADVPLTPWWVNIQIALQTWENPLPVVLPPRVGIPTQRIDAPPTRTSTNLNIILQSWDPVPTSPLPPRMKAPADRADNPPPRNPVNLLILNRTWDEPIRTPLWTTASVQDGPPIVPRDVPPPNRWGWLSTVLTSWEPAPLQPVWANRLVDASTQPVQRWDTLYTILATWNPEVPVRQRAPVVVPSGPDPAPLNPRPWLMQVLRTWDAAEPIRPRPPVVIQAGPAFVPPLSRPWLDIVLHSWDTPAPIITRMPVVTPSAPELVPPIYRPWMDLILRSWDESNPIRPRYPIVMASGPDVVPVVPPATINYQDAGDGPKKKKNPTRSTQDELFLAMEQTIRDTMAGTVAPAPARQAAPLVDLSHGLASALEQLLAAATDRHDLSLRVAQLRRDVAQYQQRLLDADDDDFMMMN